METSFIPQILKNLFYLLPHLFVLIVCIYYMVKKASVDAVLLTIGSFLGLLTSVFYMIILPLFWSYGSDSFSSREMIISAVGMVGFFGSVMFAVGMLLLIIKQVKRGV